MIVGPLGLRTNRFVTEGRKFRLVSPLYQGFVWDSIHMYSLCSTCPKDEEGHVIPRKECTCGIYAAVSPNTLRPYIKGDDYIVFLVEGIETYDLAYEDDETGWYAGFTASGVQVIGVVDHKDMISTTDTIRVRDTALYIYAAASFFNVPVLSIDVAFDLVKTQWLKLGEPWKWKGDWR